MYDLEEHWTLNGSFSKNENGIQANRGDIFMYPHLAVPDVPYTELKWDYICRKSEF